MTKLYRQLSTNGKLIRDLWDKRDKMSECRLYNRTHKNIVNKKKKSPPSNRS